MKTCFTFEARLRETGEILASLVQSTRGFVYFVILILLSLDGYGAMLRVHSETWLAGRKSSRAERESTVYEQLWMTYLSDQQTQVDLNFSYYFNFKTNTYDFDLHQLSGDFQLQDGDTHLTMGRSFQTGYLIRPSVTDSLVLSRDLLNKRLSIGVLAGKVRHFELNTDELEANVHGAFVDYKTPDVLPYRFGGRLESRDFSLVDRSRQDWGKLSIAKEWEGWGHPELTLISAQNLSNTLSYRREMGLSFYPDTTSTWGLRYQSYLMSPEELWETPISSLFSSGQIDEFGVHIGKQLESPWYLGLEIATSRYDIEPQISTRGGRGELTLKWVSTVQSLSFGVFGISSYGGRAVGGRADWDYRLTDQLELSGNHENVQYEKRTSAKTMAHSTQLGLALWMRNQFRIWLAGEYNVNNFYTEDIALVGRITLYEWRDVQ